MSNNEISGYIKIGNQDIYGIYLGDKLINGVYLGSTPIWQVIRGELQAEDGTKTSYEYKDGIVTFSGTGTIPVINSTNASELFAKASNVTEIIVEDSVTEITQGAFAAFNRLEKITLPFVGKNAKSENIIYPFGYIFEHVESNGNTKSFISRYPGDRTAYWSNIPSSLIEVILTGGQYNKTILDSNCFYGCKNLKSIYVPQTITNISSGSFYGCQTLNTLTLPFIGKTQLKNASGFAWGLAHIFIGDNPGSIDYNECRVYDAVCSSYRYYSETPKNWGTAYVPKALKNITILKGDIPPWAFNGFEGSKSNDNIIKIKILSIDNSCKYFCTQESYGAGTAYYYVNKLFLPKSILAIGEVYSSYFGEVIYYEGNNNQWEALKEKYKNEISSTYPLFDGKTINKNVNPDDF